MTFDIVLNGVPRWGVARVEIYDEDDVDSCLYIPLDQLAEVIDRLRQIQQEIELCTTDTSNGDPATDQNSNRRHDS